MFDPKTPDGLQDFKVYIKEWYGSFPMMVRAQDSANAACGAVESGLTDGETLEGPLLVKVEADTYEIIENSNGELIVKKV